MSDMDDVGFQQARAIKRAAREIAVQEIARQEQQHSVSREEIDQHWPEIMRRFGLLSEGEPADNGPRLTHDHEGMLRRLTECHERLAVQDKLIQCLVLKLCESDGA